MTDRKKSLRPTTKESQETQGLPMNRNDAIKKGLVFHTDEMLDWLQEKIGVQPEIGEAVLGAWVGVLRYTALLQAEDDRNFLINLQNGDASLHLNEQLVPMEWAGEEMWTQISTETGLAFQQIDDLLHYVGEKLHELKAERAFDPVGWFSNMENRGFEVRYWNDFLRPFNDDPEQLIYGVDFSEP